ncbi:MAG: glycosyltransferase family 4 protein [Dysgonomonas sp.]|nr:glycosyltransferase family 4 protein [Dysgonomonas sp.]
MNILHVVNVFFVVPFFFGDQFKYLGEKGHHIFLVCSPSVELEQQSKVQEFSYKEIPVQKKISPIQDLKSAYSIYKYIKNNNIDVVNGHTPKGGLLAMIAAFMARTPVRIYFRHGLVFETAKGFKRKILIWMDRLTAILSTKVVNVSPSVAQNSLKYKLNSCEKQTILSKGTCTGIDVNKFCRSNINFQYVSKIRELLAIPSDSIVIGFMGRLVRDKGIIELLEAFKVLSLKYNNIYLLLVGIVEERDALPSNIIDDIKNNEKIITTGYISNNEIQNYYALMDLYILPSYREGFPTSILEASAMELPVITTKVTGCVDAIIEGKTGIFVGHNGKSIAEGIEYFIKNKSVSKVYGQAGRKFVTDNFDQLKVWNEIEKLYK